MKKLLNSSWTLLCAVLVFILQAGFLCLAIPADANAAEKIKTDSPSWKEFKSKDGHFSIQFPAAPVVQITHQESVIGNVTNHIFTAKKNQEQFTVDYSNLPGFATVFAGRDTIYSHASGALLKKNLGKLLSSKDFLYHGQPGRHLIYELPPVPNKPTLDAEAYLFLVDKRLYVIDAIAPADTSKTPIQHFLNSLRFE